MGRHHDPTVLPCWPHSYIRAVVEGAHKVTFWAAELLIGRQVQAGLDLWPVEELIVFATHHIRQPCQFSERRPSPILAVQPHENLLHRLRMGLGVALDRGHRAAQFLAVLTVASVSERAEPLMAVGL